MKASSELARVRLYIDFGYSAERVSELLNHPLSEVRALKLGRPIGLGTLIRDRQQLRKNVSRETRG